VRLGFTILVIVRSRRSASLPPMCLDRQLQAGFVQYLLHNCRKSCYILQPACPQPGYHICSARSTAFQIVRNDLPTEHLFIVIRITDIHMYICSSTTNSSRKSIFTATVTHQQITLPTAYGGITAAIWTWQCHTGTVRATLAQRHVDTRQRSH